jgi:hypothetical protein
MPRLPLRAYAAALVLATPALASEAITRAQVLDAIRAFDSNAAGTLLAADSDDQISDGLKKSSATIIRYAFESDDVVVDLGTDSVPWCDVKKGLDGVPNSGTRGLLLAAYLSGSVKAQLLSGKLDPNPYPGWVAMLRLYRAIKVRDGTRIPEIESLLARQMDGSLESYAAEAVRRSAENLRKTYGDGAAGAQPKAGSKSLAEQP